MIGFLLLVYFGGLVWDRLTRDDSLDRIEKREREILRKLTDEDFEI